jgi:SAM-dependent MidA family methyltransferase
MRALKDRLLERIRSTGPITFAEFMEAALYDPAEGFYTRPPVGEEGHFVTSPHVSPAFGALLARQLGQAWDLLGQPESLTVLETGAGDGTLARQILDGVALVPELAAAVRYVAVERSEGARKALGEAKVEVHGSLDEVEPFAGCVVANELLDNLPFRRLRGRGEGTAEVLVGRDGDLLIEVEEDAPDDLVELLPRPLQAGQEWPVSAAALAFVDDVARVLRRGYAFVFDYGFGEGEGPGPVHAYREHRVLADVLDEPGSRDVTAAVDLDAVARRARAAGLQVWGPLSQRGALLGLGFRTWIQGLRSRQTEASLGQRWREVPRLYSERQRASILIDPDKLGALQVLVFGTEGLPPPAAALGDLDTGC